MGHSLAVHEFYAVSTHPRICDPPSTPSQAIAQMDCLALFADLVLLSEPTGYWDRVRVALVAGKVTGPLVHDARIAALCAGRGVRELWSADRDFGHSSARRSPCGIR
jgi:hypothetical protein